MVLLQLPHIKDEAAVKALMKKLGPPLVTLLSEEAEIQYVALRNISLICQRHPEILSHEIKARAPRQRQGCDVCRRACTCPRSEGPSLDKAGERTVQYQNPRWQCECAPCPTRERVRDRKRNLQGLF